MSVNGYSMPETCKECGRRCRYFADEEAVVAENVREMLIDERVYGSLGHWYLLPPCCLRWAPSKKKQVRKPTKDPRPKEPHRVLTNWVHPRKRGNRLATVQVLLRTTEPGKGLYHPRHTRCSATCKLDAVARILPSYVVFTAFVTCLTPAHYSCTETDQHVLDWAGNEFWQVQAGGTKDEK